MVNKLLVGLGIAALVLVGSVGAWKISNGGRHVGALGPLEKPVPLAWRGAWDKGAQYQPGEVVSFKGASYVAEAAAAGEAPTLDPGPWALMAAKGAQGAPGVFNGTFQSPDGRYTLSVTNAGIDASGPGGQVSIDGTRVQVKGAASIVLDATGTLDAKAGGNATVRGSLVQLGCAGGGQPAARVGSPIQAQGTGTAPYGGGPVPVTSIGTIQQGSANVFVC
jgi:hypothetical protein